MDALSGVPWWMFCVGGFSFVVVVTVMIAWQVIQGRMEKELEQNERSGKGMAPVQHPEPIHSWIRWACAHMDNGGSWLNDPAPKAIEMLRRDWQITNGQILQQALGQLSRDQPTAWNAVRLFRVAMAGVSAGYLDVPGLWNGVRPVAQRLQQAYPSYEAIWRDYLVGYRAWKQLPADGSMDDPQTIERLANIARLAQQPPPVDYRSPL